MEELVNSHIVGYLLEVLLCSGVLSAILWIIVSRVNFSVGRIIILISILLSITLPLISIGIYAPTASIEEDILASQYSIANTVLHHTDYTKTYSTNSVLSDIKWEYISVLLYIIITTYLIIKIILSAISVIRLKRGSSEITFNRKIKAPFSFLRTIYVGELTNDDDSLSMILSHEREHIRLGHSFDKIFVELCVALFWINPFFYWMQNRLYELHEFQADQGVTGKGYNIEKYKLLIFKQATGFIPDIAGGLTNLLTKKRLIMITQNTKKGWINSLLMIPAVLILMGLVSFTEKPLPESNTRSEEVTAIHKTIEDSITIVGYGKYKNMTSANKKTTKISEDSISIVGSGKYDDVTLADSVVETVIMRVFDNTNPDSLEFITIVKTKDHSIY